MLLLGGALCFRRHIMLVYIVMLVEYALFGGCASTYAPFSGGRLLETSRYGRWLFICASLLVLIFSGYVSRYLDYCKYIFLGYLLAILVPSCISLEKRTLIKYFYWQTATLAC